MSESIQADLVLSQNIFKQRTSTDVKIPFFPGNLVSAGSSSWFSFASTERGPTSLTLPLERTRRS